MKTGLTKKQKVTEVFYNAKDPAAEIYTHDTKLKKRLLSMLPSIQSYVNRKMMTGRVVCGLRLQKSESVSG